MKLGVDFVAVMQPLLQLLPPDRFTKKLYYEPNHPGRLCIDS
jgi:hypothetical protein